MLHLPPEIVLEILSHLPLNTLGIIKQVSHQWYKFVNTHESAVYHCTAVLYGYARQNAASLEDASALYSRRSVGSVTSWKDLCRKRFCIAKSWSGRGPSQVRSHCSAGNFVHRIKVDEKAGYILTTSETGGLLVTDLQQDQVLWSLPDSHVRPYAHCEYGEGFLIFDYIDGSKEVWRRVDDYREEEAALVIPESRPGARQRRVYSHVAEKYETATAISTRGHFRPWAVLRPSQLTRAFRFSYPTLGAAGRETIYLWDVRTGTLAQTIEQMQSISDDESTGDFITPPKDINYIEVSQKFVFVCGTDSLRGYSRETGRYAFEVPSSSLMSSWRFTILPTISNGKARGASLIRQETEREEVFSNDMSYVDEFVAVHISSCGRHLAALLQSSRLIIIQDFERIFKSNIPSPQLTMEVRFGSPGYSSRYLAYENGRVGVVTRTGVFVLEPLWPERSDASAPPNLKLYRIPTFGGRRCLDGVSCLQMTDTGLFLNYDVQSLPQDEDDYESMDELFYESLDEVPGFVTVEGQIMFTEFAGVAVLATQLSSNVVSVDFAAQM